MDENIRRILARAAGEAAFRDRLVTDRAAALEGAELSASERAVLLAVPDDTLRRMIEDTKPGHSRRLGCGSGMVALGLVALGVGLTVPTLGHTAERAETNIMRSHLRVIAAAHEQYLADHGVYPDVESLVSMEELSFLHDETAMRGYVITIEEAGGHLRATARHATRPHTRLTLHLLPDGSITDESEPISE